MSCLWAPDTSKVNFPGMYPLMNKMGTWQEQKALTQKLLTFTLMFVTAVELACPQEERSLKRTGFPRAFLARSRR